MVFISILRCLFFTSAFGACCNWPLDVEKKELQETWCDDLSVNIGKSGCERVVVSSMHLEFGMSINILYSYRMHYTVDIGFRY